MTERGTMESQNNVEILCEVEDVQGDGINGTPILWIIENGLSVKKGDLLVELDTALAPGATRQSDSGHRTGARQRDPGPRELRESRHPQQDGPGQGRLDVELADLALQQYEDEHGGTYQIECQESSCRSRSRKHRRTSTIAT